MAPIEPLLPGELAPDHTDTGHTGHHDPSSSSRRRSHSVTAAMLSAAEPEPPLSRSPSSAAMTSDSRTTTGGSRNIREKLGLGGVARRTLGIGLLLIVVFLWTLSNFMASYIFSDGTYSKPFFLVYVNTSCFAISLIPLTIRYVMQNGVDALMGAALQMWREKRLNVTPLRMTGGDEGRGGGADDEDAGQRLLVDDEGSLEALDLLPPGKEEKLSLGETARLSLEFAMLWFGANYFASACLEYTSVGSVTILTSTSSIWTLIFCALTKVEGFTVRKLVGVLASLAGVVLISSVDLSGANDDNRGSFPHKTTAQIAIGDAMAFFSAIIYGIYVTVMKRRVGNEERVNMPLFFGLVGLFNVLFLWPGFFILHYTGIEPFELPPTASVWTIIAVNSAASFFSDILWAYAMLLTTPLVVTVGLSLNIPLSLIGEMIQYSQYSSWLYWVGAGVVFISFLFVNNESHEDDADGKDELARGAERSAV
ncbi:hypothetical protein C8A01DRAFT_48831 [Parachaetomium inaequale]|uniref:EamA domain-containing protein n=1 Tax=Parachaetomium inaequale TaxID=2588326 RepID=A0AAN6SP48_9PEZI|nr:hypothetical protein C8A01DRAFT_48831 [Parachaetomium inaequale]